MVRSLPGNQLQCVLTVKALAGLLLIVAKISGEHLIWFRMNTGPVCPNIVLFVFSSKSFPWNVFLICDNGEEMILCC